MSRGFQAVQNELRKLLGILQTSNKVKELKTAMHSLITFLEQQNIAQIIDTMAEQTRSTGANFLRYEFNEYFDFSQSRSTFLFLLLN